MRQRWQEQRRGSLVNLNFFAPKITHSREPGWCIGHSVYCDRSTIHKHTERRSVFTDTHTHWQHLPGWLHVVALLCLITMLMERPRRFYDGLLVHTLSDSVWSLHLRGHTFAQVDQCCDKVRSCPYHPQTDMYISCGVCSTAGETTRPSYLCLNSQNGVCDPDWVWMSLPWLTEYVWVSTCVHLCSHASIHVSSYLRIGVSVYLAVSLSQSLFFLKSSQP